MASNTDNIKLGVCTVIFDGVDLGFTKGGVELELQTSTHEVKVDQTGETPVNELITGRSVSVKVPLAETTLENLARTMPGSTLVTNGVKATGTVTFSTGAPVAGDKVTINGQDFTFKASPAGIYEIAVPASISAAATALAAAVNNAAVGVTAEAATGVVTLTATEAGVFANTYALAKTAATPANISVSGATLSGGVDASRAKVVIPTGTSISLLQHAKRLVLRPKGTSGAEDVVIPKAATPGSMQFAYKLDDERVYMTNFKGYATANAPLMIVGDEGAV